MAEVSGNIRALALLTGSLDSQLAIRLLQEQGVYVEAIAFTSPIFDTSMARGAARQLGVSLLEEDCTPAVVTTLRDGFVGQVMAPCPCHIFRTIMLKRAADVLAERRMDFIATGEIVDQRGAVQSLENLEAVAMQSGCASRIVRPLSARLLPKTAPELDGTLARDKLLSLQGRCRKQQIELARQHHLEDYPQHSGLCRMSEPSFERRVHDLLEHEGLQGEASLLLAGLGRHFRLGPATKLVVARNEKENHEIEGRAELYDLLLKADGVQGPTGLLPFTATEEEIMKAGSICARYADGGGQPATRVGVRSPKTKRWIEVQPADEATLEQLRI